MNAKISRVCIKLNLVWSVLKPGFVLCPKYGTKLRPKDLPNEITFGKIVVRWQILFCLSVRVKSVQDFVPVHGSKFYHAP